MKFVIFLFFVFVATVHGCPPGFDTLLNGKCMQYQNVQYGGTAGDFDSAHSLCKSKKGYMLMLKTAEEEAAMMQIARTHFNDHCIFLDLNCDLSTNTWTWADGTVAQYINHNLDRRCTEDKRLNFNPSSGKWEGLDFLFVVINFCQMPDVKRGSCEDFSVLQSDNSNRCYMTGAPVNSWETAQMRCRNENSDVSSIHSSSDNSFIRRLQVASGAQDLYLGATNVSQGSFAWSDASTVNYRNFAQGEPNVSNGGCLGMKVSETLGEWHSVHCDSKLPYVCVRNETDQYRPVGPATCQYKTFYPGDHLYSPNFPIRSSNFPCTYIIKAPEGMRAKVMVHFFESNYYEGYLSIYESTDNLIATLYGTNYAGLEVITYYSNVMTLRWYPNGASNVRGFHLIAGSADFP